MPGAEEGADGFEKFPACSRCSSSWFSWLAVPPVIGMLYRDDTPPSRDDTPPSFCGGNAPVCDDGLAASPSWSRTSKTAASPREPSPRGGAVRGPDSADPPGFGPELYGVSPGPPGFGPGVPMELPPDGLVLRPNGRRKRERGDHRHTGQKMMFHVCDPLSRSSVGHGRTIRVAAVWSKSSPLPFRWYSQRSSWKVRRHHRPAARPRPLAADELTAFRFCSAQPVINDKACRHVPHHAIFPPHLRSVGSHVIAGSSSWQAQQ